MSSFEKPALSRSDISLNNSVLTVYAGIWITPRESSVPVRAMLVGVLVNRLGRSSRLSASCS
jgi:hypothetical protein